MVALPLLWQRILRRDRSHDATGKPSLIASLSVEVALQDEGCCHRVKAFLPLFSFHPSLYHHPLGSNRGQPLVPGNHRKLGTPRKRFSEDLNSLRLFAQAAIQRTRQPDDDALNLVFVREVNELLQGGIL